MADKHLYEFEEGGFYAAESREQAFECYNTDCDYKAEEDFKRDVPDDELIEVMGELPDDKWDDPREYQKLPTKWRSSDPRLEPALVLEGDRA